MDNDMDAITARRYRDDWHDAVTLLNNQDILISRMKRVLRIIGYPRRGTPEEHMNYTAALALIHSEFSLEELSIARPIGEDQ